MGKREEFEVGYKFPTEAVMRTDVVKDVIRAYGNE